MSRQSLKFDLEKFCKDFPEQLNFIRDPAKFKTAVCSRRAGKTVGCAADLIDTALNTKDIVCLYITLKRTNAKRLIWPELLKINREEHLGGHTNETDLSMRFDNGSVIYCSGAKDKSEIENFRGLALKKTYLDEAQSFRPYIRDLIDDVISKALFDYDGTLCLTGTPGLVPAGYFYECSQSPEWSHHFWTMFQNPHLERKSGKKVMDLVLEDCKRMGVTIDHPKIQRECFGRWTVDTDSLVFKYNAERNHFDFDIDLKKEQWNTIIAVDLGFDDSDAIAVIGWKNNERVSYLLKEDICAQQGVTELANKIELLIKTYNPLKIVMDTGGLGKKIAEEISKRYSIPIKAAEKSRKFEFIELLNDAMRTSRFFARKNSGFAEDSMLVEWDLDKTTPEKKVISDTFHSDICDAVLYGWRESLHWLEEDAVIKPKVGTEAWLQAQAKEAEETLLRKLEQENSDKMLSDLGFDQWQ